VTLAYGNPETDIAFLLPTEQLSSTPFTVPFAIRSQDANLGETVYTLGYPREDIVYGEGAVSAATGYEQNENSYQISIPVNPGNSGGPMIDGQGSVVGIINGVQTETRSAAFAVKSRVLWDEIKNAQNDSTLTVPMKISNQNQLTNLSRVNQIKKWKDFVFVVKVYHGK
jgi:S1-C subfamily serine protease